MIERPQYVNEIMKYMDKPFVKILTGVRRSGKLTIMLMIKEQLRQKGIQEERILHYNFDSLQYENMKNSRALYEMLSEKLKKSKNRVYLFFDEIQEVQDWEKVLEQLLDGIREHDGAGGVGEQAGARDERHDTHRHQHSIAHALGINGQKPDMHQRFALA